MPFSPASNRDPRVPSDLEATDLVELSGAPLDPCPLWPWRDGAYETPQGQIKTRAGER